MRESDGSQILSLKHPMNKTLYFASGLGGKLLFVRLVLNKQTKCISLFINGIEHGSFALVASNVAASEPPVMLGARDGKAAIESFKLREWVQ